MERKNAWSKYTSEKDLKKVMECRKIVDKISWDCQVYKNYSDINLGCGLRPSTGITWAFSKVNELIILEDDCVVDEPEAFASPPPNTVPRMCTSPATTFVAAGTSAPIVTSVDPYTLEVLAPP